MLSEPEKGCEKACGAFKVIITVALIQLTLLLLEVS